MQARDALARGNRVEALALLKKVLGKSPTHAIALQLLDEASDGAAVPFCVLDHASTPSAHLGKLNPLVSITILTYNHDQYVRECVDSVLAQTYSPLEIIISDDGSTDRTADIIASRLARYRGDHRVTFERHPKNLGRYGRGNWVDSFRRTQGDFVVQFCGDDVMRPNMIEKMVYAWQSMGVSAVTVNAEYIDRDSRSLDRYHRDPFHTPDCSIETLARNGATDGVFGAGMGFDRQVFEVFPFSRNTPPIHLGTLDMMFSFYGGLLAGCMMIQEPLMKYRVHGTQTSLSIAHDMANDAERKLIVEEKMWQGHLAHAVFMSDVLDELAACQPKRFGYFQAHLRPRLFEQMATMSFRLVRVRERLYYDFGIKEMQAPET